MTIIVEDGTGKTNAETYISVSEADTFHAAYGNTAWDLLDTEDKEIYLRKATRFMVGKFRLNWKGTRTNVDQALDWPRAGVVIEDSVGGLAQFASGYGYYEIDYNIVPKEVKEACAELALKASTGDLVTDQNRSVVSETVGPITVLYDKDSPEQVQYLEVTRLLSPYLKTRGPNFKLART